MEVCVPTVPAYDDENDAFEPGLWMHLAEVVQWVARLDGLVEPARPFRIKRFPRPKSGSSAGRTLCRLVQTGWVNFGDSDHPEIKIASAKVRAALEEDKITVWTQDDLGRMAPVDPVRWSREAPKANRVAVPRFKFPGITGTFLVLRKEVLNLWPDPDVRDPENAEVVGPFVWSDFAPETVPELVRLCEAAMLDEWWSWPEALAWAGSQDVKNVATLRHCATKWANGSGPDVTLESQHYMARQWCRSPQISEAELFSAIVRGSIGTIGCTNFDGHATPLPATKWRNGIVIYCGRTANLASAKYRATIWAYDVAVRRLDLIATFAPSPSDRASPEPADELVVVSGLASKAGIRKGRAPGTGFDDSLHVKMALGLIKEHSATSATKAAQMIVTSHGNQIGGASFEAKVDRIRRQISKQLALGE